MHQDEINKALKIFSESLPKDAMSSEEAVCLSYASDSSRMLFKPNAVVWPSNEEQVVQIVKLANETKLPLYPRGRGTATTGASLAELGGIVVSSERMDNIIAIDTATRTVTVEPGVLNAKLDEALQEHGYMWPPDPSSSAYCSIGGNLATGSAGPRGIKYGGVRENVLALRAVCGDGSVIESGAKVAKSSVGYDFARLLIGAEGTLAFITEATLRLAVRPKATSQLAAHFESSKYALDAVCQIQKSGATLSALEFLDEGCLAMVGAKQAGINKDTGALLLIASDGSSEKVADEHLQITREVLKNAAGLIAIFDEATKVWQARKVLSQKQRELGAYKINEDVVVPLDALAMLVDNMQILCKDAKIDCVIFGHAGQGNLHFNLLFEQEKQRDKANEIVDQLMEQVLKASGSISGEHGVGISKRVYAPKQIDKATQELSLKIKRTFDPNEILNPQRS